MLATRHLRAGIERDLHALGADRDGAVEADLEFAVQAPYIRPPRIALEWALDIAAISTRPCLGRRHPQFAMDLVFVVVEAQLLQMAIGLRDVANRFGLEAAWQPVLPVVGAAAPPCPWPAGSEHNAE
jgi:hypothetical protein